MINIINDYDKIKPIMRTSVLSFMLIALLPLSGCVYLVVGGLGAVGGYVVSPDTVEGVTSSDEQAVWEMAHEVISMMGTIQEEASPTEGGASGGGIILAKVNGAKVTIKIVPINDSATKLTVKARKAFLPKISLAQDIFVKIMSNLME